MASHPEDRGSFVRYGSDPAARLRIFCFPFAGGGASMYYPWAPKLPAGVTICPIHLPGRENRLAEPPSTSLPRLVDELASELGPALRMGSFAFFGHSLGGLIAFELARLVERELGLIPAHLFVSAARAPGDFRRSSAISHLGDEAFLAAMGRRYGGLPAAVLQDRELMALFLPALRADFSLFDAYQYAGGDPIGTSISAFGGTEDEEVRLEDLEGWRGQTRGRFRLRMLPGGHFFLKTSPELLISAMMEDLGALAAS